MAGGYICKKFEWDGGRTDTHAERCAYVLKGCAQALLDTNTGWSLDTAKNATLDDYTQASGDFQSNGSTSSPCYLLFFKSTSGAKLCLGYRYGYGKDTADHSAIPNGDCAGKLAVLGLFAAYIDVGLAGEFSTSSPYRPGDSTLFTSPCHATLASYEYGNDYTNASFACSNTTNITYQYFIITNGTNVILLNHSNVTAYASCYGCTILGRLFSTLFNGNEGDTLKGGTICIGRSGTNKNSYNTYETDFSGSPAGRFDGINDESYWAFDYTGNYDSYWRCKCYQKADGTWLTGTFTNYAESNGYGARSRADSDQLNASVGTKRWVPIYVYGWSDPSLVANYEVANGNTLKGYIDPDLMRGVNAASRYARGTTFDNGNLIYLGGGLAVGWDPSNTVAIF